MAGRLFLTTATTYYIRSDGNDGNTGLVNSAGGAFLTWAHALNVITQTLDFGGQVVTLYNGNAATYTTEIFVNASWVGGGGLVIDLGGGGICASPGHKAFLNTATLPGPITVQNGTLNAVTFCNLQNAGIGTVIIGPGLIFNGCGEYDIEATNFGALIGGSGANYTVSASGAGQFGHVGARSGGEIFLVGATANFTASVTYASGFAVANLGGLIAAGGGSFRLNGHTATGPRFAVTQGGNIDTQSGGLTYFPGSSAGTIGPGGIYDAILGIGASSGRTVTSTPAHDFRDLDATEDSSIFAPGGVGYATGSGGAVTQATSRTTGVTLNKVSGAITLFSQVNTAISAATAQSFTLTNSAIAATDVVHVTQQSGTDKYQCFVTNTAAGSCVITSYSTGGTTNEAPVFNFVIIKGVTS
jgi:hypothetical protein